jgi:hypothetical protein
MTGIPFISYRADEDFEVNIWGDPPRRSASKWACSTCGHGTRTPASRCRRSLPALMSDTKDREVVERLSREKDDQVREGLTFEVMPPEAAGSYHVWWLRVFDDRTMDLERGGDEELRAITSPAVQTSRHGPTNVRAAGRKPRPRRPLTGE